MYLVWTSDLSPYLTDSAASRMVMAIIPAERYIIDPITGVNLTLQAACLAIAESFNRLSREGLNVCDLYSGETVMELRGYVTAFRGDWKALKQTFNFKRYADQVCWQCAATKGLSPESLALAYTNVNTDAPWVATIGDTLPWDYEPGYTLLEGFDVKFIHADLLHIYHLGTGRDLVGSALVHMLETRGFFEGSNIAARLASATLEVRRFCKERKLPLKLHKLSRSKLNWNTADMPELRSSGYDTYVVKWLVEVTTRHSAQLPAQLCTALWTADQILSTLAKAGRWLSVEEQELKECYGALFTRSYVEVANSSLERRKRAYRLRPKLHLWHHILKESRPPRINPHVFSTWTDEDALKK
ncbi:unnamed protein product [Symbiodinium pilosum]|uniref:Uncharacterized protein n=1 Tax=Symbiodinium pilosum TaxID=2952 RepID=A0A812KWD1_SYMPI|nr:unnamed protein product [Symbiodinium pilosum]